MSALDPDGQVSLMLCESILHILVEEGVISKDRVLDAINGVVGVRRADNGTWNHVDTTIAHSGYAKTRERAGQLLCCRYERMVRDDEI